MPRKLRPQKNCKIQQYEELWKDKQLSKRKSKQWKDQITKNYSQNFSQAEESFKFLLGKEKPLKMIPGESIMNFQYSDIKQKSINAAGEKALWESCLIQRPDNSVNEQ